MMGIQPARRRTYFLPSQPSSRASRRYFGVRTNSVCLPTIASITALELVTAKPMPVAIRNGMYLMRLRHSSRVEFALRHHVET